MAALKPRQHLVERFSTYIQWNNNEFGTWIADPRLRRSIENCLSQESTTSEQYWILFWHKDWLNRRQEVSEREISMYSHHLYAYLQEPCYRPAKTIYEKYQKYLSYTIEDYFNMGFLHMDNILSKYNPRLNPNLAAYTASQFKWRIIDEVRRLNHTTRCTIWRLLHDCSPTRLKKALIDQKISPEIYKNYLIAWDCYKEIYSSERVTSSSRLQEPDSKNWEQITKAYNQNTLNGETDVETIKKWLNICGKSLKNFPSPPTTSINAPVLSGEKGELQDTLLDEKQLTPLAQAEAEEIKEEFQKIYQCLVAKIVQLEPRDKLELEMYYSEKLKTPEIAKRLGIAQGTVSKRMTKAKKRLASELIDWSKENLDSPLKVEDIKTISTTLGAWLEYHYQSTGINNQGG